MESHAVVAFGRMNPPTIGHQALVDAVRAHAQKVGGIPEVHLSKSQDAKKNPLSYRDKLGYAKKAFGDIVKDSPAKNPLDVLKGLHGKVDHVTFVAGDDRVDDYKNLLNRYNGHPDHYTFKSINVISAGSRDPDAEGVEGMSASKMREHASKNNRPGFQSGLPSTLQSDSNEIMSKVKKGMGMSESFSSIIRRVIAENRQNIQELRTAKKASYRVKSLRAGEDRRHDVGREQAAFKQQDEKNPGLKPRNIKPYEAKKVNKQLVFNQVDQSTGTMLSESYDSFYIEKPVGYGTFMTAKDFGIKFESAFEHHPSVVKELYRRRTKRKKQREI